MIRYDGMKAEASKPTRGQLPAGPYVAKILDARIEGKEPDQQLALLLDIAEGEYANFYMDKYNAAKERGSQYEIKYKGILRLRIPNPENTKAQYPVSDYRRFNDMIFRFESSNPGFTWDGDEKKLKGLLVGISVQEDSFNGNVFTRPARLETADEVRQGKVKVMEPRKREDPTTPPARVDSQSGMTVVQEQLPWDHSSPF